MELGNDKQSKDKINHSDVLKNIVYFPKNHTVFGEILRERMDAINETENELSDETFISIKKINGILKNKVLLSEMKEDEIDCINEALLITDDDYFVKECTKRNELANCRKRRMLGRCIKDK